MPRYAKVCQGRRADPGCSWGGKGDVLVSQGAGKFAHPTETPSLLSPNEDPFRAGFFPQHLAYSAVRLSRSPATQRNIIRWRIVRHARVYASHPNGWKKDALRSGDSNVDGARNNSYC